MAAKSKKEGYGKIRVFVYGTLKKGRWNNRLLQQSGATFLGHDSITDFVQMVDLGHFPGIIPVSHKVGQATVFGEVYAGDGEMLDALDMLEGNGHFYTRVKMRTDRLDLNTWVYTLPVEWEKEAKDVVADGLWNPSAAELAFWEEARGGGAESVKE